MLLDRADHELKALGRAGTERIQQQQPNGEETKEVKPGNKHNICILRSSEPATSKRKSTDLIITSSGEFVSSTGKGPRGTSDAGVSLPPFAQDAYLLLQDLCTLTGGDAGSWLNLDSIPKNFGLELIESILTTHPHVFIEVAITIDIFLTRLGS
jgi:hypothetical protein